MLVTTRLINMDCFCRFLMSNGKMSVVLRMLRSQSWIPFRWALLPLYLIYKGKKDDIVFCLFVQLFFWSYCAESLIQLCKQDAIWINKY